MSGWALKELLPFSVGWLRTDDLRGATWAQKQPSFSSGWQCCVRLERPLCRPTAASWSRGEQATEVGPSLPSGAPLPVSQVRVAALLPTRGGGFLASCGSSHPRLAYPAPRWTRVSPAPLVRLSPALAFWMLQTVHL